MRTPKVSILLATYNPDIDWLVQQLTSLNKQTYENTELIVCDDCSTSIDEVQLKDLLGQYITNFPFHLVRNETNLGSNQSFERLTQVADGEYFAYCDQDDIWEADKISVLIKVIAQKGAILAYSDMSIIDGDGKQISDSITKVRKRFQYYEGYELWRRILIRNFISGCCMIIENKTAKSAIPFELGMQHDRWLALCASIQGNISLVNQPLVRYRQHGKNQTGVLKNITDKKSYCKIRLHDHIMLLESIRKRFEQFEAVRVFLDEYIKQVQVRHEYATGNNKNIFKMLSYIKENKSTILFEIIALKLPNYIFNRLVSYIISNSL